MAEGASGGGPCVRVRRWGRSRVHWQVAFFLLVHECRRERYSHVEEREAHIWILQVCYRSYRVNLYVLIEG